MKSMLIAASAIGAACAGLILYLRRKPAAATKTLNGNPVKGELQYRSQHAMG